MSAGIECRGLSFHIGGFALQGVNLTVNAGEYYVLTGPNGAGKTVLLKLLCGLYRPAAGQVCVGGEDQTDVPPWRRRIGYVPQEGALFPHLSVRANIEFGARARGMRHVRKRAQAAADRVGIGNLLDRGIAGLSGGETQKVALARALAPDPAILLLDEPVSAIDEDTRDPLCGELKRLQRDLAITTVHISHNRRETALVADRVGVLRDGAIRPAPTVVASPRSCAAG